MPGFMPGFLLPYEMWGQAKALPVAIADSEVGTFRRSNIRGIGVRAQISVSREG